jgi:glycosyltransferase involved in cell wall biosynthesis
MKIINNNPLGYAELRNINVFGINSIKYIDDVFSFGNKLKHKLTGKGYNVFYKGLFYSIKDQKTPCHLFNSINLGKNPWIVTFETTLPRLGEGHSFWYSLSVKKLANSNCKRIIALSQCTFSRQIDYLKQNYPEYLSSIQKKMLVMHPPQALLINNYEEKSLESNSLIFTIVGADFFRKGGREVLNVFSELIPLYPQLKLNIISSLLFNDYASKATTEDYNKALEIIHKFPDNIFHYKGLPNAEVLSILTKSHVGLLPSWGDTYGYSVLEAQAAGCPVITTNLRSFPEINNNKIGWVLELPLNAGMDADIDTKEKRLIFQGILEDGLRESVLEMLAFPNLIKEKGLACIQRIKEDHSPQNYKERLLQMYTENFK